jgi:hypothetical protein
MHTMLRRSTTSKQQLHSSLASSGTLRPSNLRSPMAMADALNAQYADACSRMPFGNTHKDYQPKLTRKTDQPKSRHHHAHHATTVHNEQSTSPLKPACIIDYEADARMLNHPGAIAHIHKELCQRKHFTISRFPSITPLDQLEEVFPTLHKRGVICGPLMVHTTLPITKYMTANICQSSALTSSPEIATRMLRKSG